MSGEHLKYKLKKEDIIMVYGYARVSSKEQCEARQLMAFDRIHISKENIFVGQAKRERTLTEQTTAD